MADEQKAPRQITRVGSGRIASVLAMAAMMADVPSACGPASGGQGVKAGPEIKAARQSRRERRAAERLAIAEAKRARKAAIRLARSAASPGAEEPHDG